MLYAISVNSENSFDVSILGVTPKETLLLRKIDGLGPPGVGLFIGDYARDGGYYQGRRVGNRNVVFTFDLNPDPASDDVEQRTISGLRKKLYKAFMDPLPDADYVKVTLLDYEVENRYVVGYTEKFETDIFSVETVAQISMICTDPYIRADDDVTLTYPGAPPSGWTAVPFTYEGTAETGFEARIFVVDPTSILTLENNLKTMVITKDFLYGDEIYVNTIRGQRQLILTRAGDSESIIGNLDEASPWIELHSQSNTLQIYGASILDSPAVIRVLQYVPAYWGI